MSVSRHSEVGLDHVVSSLARRYDFDAVGRIAGSRQGTEGGTPRFVLGRAREGVVWRFRADLDPTLIVEIARLASREQGFPIDGEARRAPERLAAIMQLVDRDERVRGGEGRGEGRSPHRSAFHAQGHSGPGAPSARHDWVSHEGVVVGELWSID